jgi:hypothetical protein
MTEKNRCTLMDLSKTYKRYFLALKMTEGVDGKAYDELKGKTYGAGMAIKAYCAAICDCYFNTLVFLGNSGAWQVRQNEVVIAEGDDLNINVY